MTSPDPNHRERPPLAHTGLEAGAGMEPALHLTAGQAHDGRHFEALYESLAAENVLGGSPARRGYDADLIRGRLACDGIEAVIPALRVAALRCATQPH